MSSERNKCYRNVEEGLRGQICTKSTTYYWYKFFKDGRERVKDKERLGRPSTSTDDDHIQKEKDLVLLSRRLTIRDIADEIGASKESVNSILKDVLVLKRVKSRLVPKMH